MGECDSQNINKHDIWCTILLYKTTGEGAIPVYDEPSPSLVSLQFGRRLRTMTCSDKLLKWNVLGIQGALLTHLLHPVYIDTLTIGESAGLYKIRLVS